MDKWILSQIKGFIGMSETHTHCTQSANFCVRHYCLPKGRLSEGAHEKRILCAQKCSGWNQVWWGGMDHEIHIMVGWLIVGWGGVGEIIDVTPT